MRAACFLVALVAKTLAVDLAATRRGAARFLKASSGSLLQTGRSAVWRRLADIGGTENSSLQAAYECFAQIVDALPGGGYRRRLGGDFLVELPDARCTLLQEASKLDGPSSELEQEAVHASSALSQVRAIVRAARLPLVPYPANVSLAGQGASAFSLSADTKVVLGDGVREGDSAVQALREHLSRLQRRSVRSKAAIHLALDKEAGQGAAEGYSLAIDGGKVALSAPAAAGLFYGVQSLKQITPTTGPADLPALAIEDFPRFGWRGLHLDVSRHFFEAKDVKKLLDVMASLKLNRFHWHLTDDQGWRLPVEGYPKLSTVGAEGVSSGAYTAEEIKGVVEYAHARHIKVLPEVDVPGHAAAAIAAYPELGNSDVAGWAAPDHPIQEWGAQKFTMAPSSTTMQFLEEVFTQVAELFPDAMLHIGGDEVSNQEWQRSKKARALMKSQKLKSVQAYFNSKCAAMLSRMNISMVAWDEAPSVGGFPQDAVVMAWRSKDEVRKAARAGRQVINADQGALYFDHYQGPHHSEPKAFGGYTPLKNVYAYDMVPSGLTHEQQRLILGGQAELWSEFIPDWKHAEYMAFPRSHALAEKLWTPIDQLHGFPDFVQRLGVRLQDLDRQGVRYRKL